MKKRLISYLLFGLLVPLVTSCTWQTLVREELYIANLPITIDWTESQIDEEYTQNVSIYLFPTDGSEPYRLISGDLNFALVEVPIGVYSVLIFNDAVDNLSGLSFSGVDSYETMGVRVTQSSGVESYYQTSQDDYIVASHDSLAVWSLDNILVTANMVEYTRSQAFVEYIDQLRDGGSDGVPPLSILSQEEYESMVLLLDQFIDIKPVSALGECNISVRVENLNNAISVEMILKGMASGVILSSLESIESEDVVNCYKLDVTQRQYDIVDGLIADDGELTHNLITFGPNGQDAQYELVVNIIISTGQLYTFVRDVSDQVNGSPRGQIDICLDQLDNMIILPEYSEGGIGAGEWGEGGDISLI